MDTIERIQYALHAADYARKADLNHAFIGAMESITEIAGQAAENQHAAIIGEHPGSYKGPRVEYEQESGSPEDLGDLLEDVEEALNGIDLENNTLDHAEMRSYYERLSVAAMRAANAAKWGEKKIPVWQGSLNRDPKQVA